MKKPTIIHRGRGPEIAGTRITVYDIMDYTREDWHPAAIAATLRISSEEVLVALEYIESHQAEVTAAYQRILDRDAAGNPPEIRARLAESHKRVQAMLRDRGLVTPKACLSPEPAG